MPRMTRMSDNDKEIARYLYESKVRRWHSEEYVRWRIMSIHSEADNYDSVLWWLKWRFYQELSYQFKRRNAYYKHLKKGH